MRSASETVKERSSKRGCAPKALVRPRALRMGGMGLV
jgi:hypothetical protein